MKALHNTIIALAAFMVLLGMAISPSSSWPVAGATQVEAPAQYTFNDLLDAIEWEESKGDAGALGDWTETLEEGAMGAGLTFSDPKAVGAYQIHKIYVDDVNRIVGENIYSYNDRCDKNVSREMVGLYIRYYGFKFCGDPRDGNEGPSYEVLARIHNGGPRGYLKESTKAYWLNIKARMDATK